MREIDNEREKKNGKLMENNLNKHTVKDTEKCTILSADVYARCTYAL